MTNADISRLAAEIACRLLKAVRQGRLARIDIDVIRAAAIGAEHTAKGGFRLLTSQQCLQLEEAILRRTIEGAG